MIIVKLFCQNGASTAMLAKKIQQAAEKEGLEMEVTAYPESTIAKNIIGADIVLLAPQIRFKQKDIMEKYPQYKYLVVDSFDYGMMHGDKVLVAIKKELGL